MKKAKHYFENFEPFSNKTQFSYLEAFKTFRTNVEFVTSTDNCKSIMMTSALSGEGKTTASINLAIALAQNGKRVIVCDCDLRKPKIQRYLRIKTPAQNGVSTVLNGSCSLDNAIGYVEEMGIYVMLSGTTPPNPAELLSSERSKKMLEDLKAKFDYVICDSPPVAIVSDALALCQYMDGCILVVRQNYAFQHDIKECLNKFRMVDANMLGVMLNNYDVKTDSNYKYDKYYSYSDSNYYGTK